MINSPRLRDKRLRPATASARIGALLILILPSTLAGSALTAVALQGSPHSVLSADCADPFDPALSETRMQGAAGYVKYWAKQIGPDGTAPVTSYQLRSCYNLLTMEKLPEHSLPEHSSPGPVVPGSSSPPAPEL